MRRQPGSLGLLLIVCLVASLFAASIAQASTSYVSAGSLGDGAVGAPARIAVEESTGNVLVVDSAGKVNVFDSSGPGAPLLTSFGEGELGGAYGIAVDQTNGDVYVTDPVNEEIARYETDGAEPPTYTLDAGYTGPAAGSGSEEVGSFSSAIAIDPTSGDLLLADRGNNRVSRLDDTGAFVSSFDGADSTDGAFTHLEDLALSPVGKIFVTDAAGEAAAGSPSRVVRFSGAGAYQATLRAPAGEGDAYLAFDASSDELIVGDARSFFFGTTVFHILDSSNGAVLFNVAVPSEELTGVALDSGAARLYVASARGEFFAAAKVAVFNAQTHPDLALDPPSAITDTSVHLSGTVNPDGVPTKYRFEISNDGGATWAKAPEPDGDAGEGTSPVAVEADLTVEPNTEYVARLVGVTELGVEDFSATRTFTSGTAVPATVTGGISQLTEAGATLNGTINPFGEQASYHFEYGATTGYGSQAPADHDAVAGKGRTPLAVSQVLTGLAPGTTYHYRLVAENETGSQAGADMTFTTVGDLGPNRAYELVSPAHKGDVNVLSAERFFTTPDGENLVFAGQTVLGDQGSESAPLFPRYRAQRSDLGWSTRAIDPPQGEYNYGYAFNFTVGLSEDGTKAVVISTKALTPDAVDNDSNVYLRDIATGEYTLMAAAPGPELYGTESTFADIGERFMFANGTPDLDRVLLWGRNTSFLPGVPANSLYEFHDGQLSVVSLAPDGSPMESLGATKYIRGVQTMSADGSRVFFKSGAFGGEAGVIYLRTNGETKVISESRRASDPGTAQTGWIVGASRNGDFLFFVSHDLTDDSDPGALTLYRYTTSTESLQMLTKTNLRPDEYNQEQSFYQVNPAGDTVYFRGANLTPDAPESERQIYAWRSGQLSAVAPGGPGMNESSVGANWWTSPNGRYFAFLSYWQVTNYDPSSSKCAGGRCLEAYRYDADTDEVVCISCPPDGQQGSGFATFGNQGTIEGPAVNVSDPLISNAFTHSVTNDGRVFFDSPERLSVKDSNSLRDVYEFDGSTTRLISTAGGKRSDLAAVGAEGRDVFFTTEERLVRSDTDNAMDVYDARIGGGISSQNSEPPSACSGANCRSGAASPPSPVPASEGVQGRGNLKPQHRKKHCGNGRRPRKVKGKHRCVKHKGASKSRDHTNRRLGR